MWERKSGVCMCECVYVWVCVEGGRSFHPFIFVSNNIKCSLFNISSFISFHMERFSLSPSNWTVTYCSNTYWEQESSLTPSSIRELSAILNHHYCHEEVRLWSFKYYVDLDRDSIFIFLYCPCSLPPNILMNLNLHLWICFLLPVTHHSAWLQSNWVGVVG